MKRFRDGDITETELKGKAREIVHAQKSEATKGRFPTGRTNESKLWRNLYASSTKGTRIKIVGEFADGKLPMTDGKVDWFKKDKNGVQAWKKVKFVDTQTPKGNVTFKWNGFADQVNNTFGKGSFKRFSKTYDLQQVYANENFMYEGKKVRLGTILNKRLLIRDLTKKLKRAPTQKEIDKYFAKKKPGFSFIHAHHPEGIAKNPWKTDLSFIDENFKLRDLEKTNLAKIKKTSDAGEVKKITQRWVDDIKAQPAGIKYKMPSGETVGR